MQVRVDINKVEIMQTEQVNSGEYNTRELQFNIAENMRGLILKALFTKDYKTYEVDIENDSCMIPWEVLKTDGNCELGVYAYSVNGEVLEIRYSPEPTKFYINAGSYKSEVENGEQPTPTRTEVLEGKIKELDNKKVDKKEGYGLSQNDFTNELKDKLDKLNTQDDKVVKGHYDEENKQIILELQSGNKIAIPVNDLLDDFYVKQTIDNLLQEQQEQLDILNSEIEPNTLSGESVVVADGVTKTKVASIINGNSYQETTEGYNKLYLFKNETVTRNGITAEIKKNEVTLNGTSTGLTDFYLLSDWGDTTENENRKLKAGKYTLVNYGDSNIVSVNMYNGTKILMNLAKTENIKVVNFTADTYYSVMYISIPMGTTLTNFKLKLGLLEGAYTLDTLPPYEPYTNGASPNTEYEQDIEVVDNAYNLCDTTEFTTLVTNGGITFTNVGNGGIKVSGTATNLVVAKVSKPINIEAGTKCYISGGISEDVSVDIRDSSNNTVGTRSTTPNANTEIIVSRDIEGSIAIRIASGVTVDTTIYPFLSTQDLPYLPYGHIGLLQRGKNIFNVNDKLAVDSLYTINEDDSISVSYDNTNGTQSKYCNYYTNKTNRLKPSTKYKVVAEVLDISGTGYFNISTSMEGTSDSQIDSSSGNFGYDFTEIKKGDVLSKTITTKADFNNAYNMIRTYVAFGVGKKGSITFRISVVDEEIDTSNFVYEKYREPKTIPINLNGNSIAKVGDIKDILNIGVDGRVKIGDKVIKEYVFTGDENIKIGTTKNNTQVFEVTFADSKNNNNILCNYLPNFTSGDVEVIKKSGMYVFMGISKDVAETVDELKTLLKEKYENGEPLKIMYVLDTPQTIDLPSIEPITLFEGTNVFELVTNLGTTMAVTYKVSNKKQIKNLQAQINELKTSIVRLGVV